MLPMMIELMTLGLWDLRATDCAKEACRLSPNFLHIQIRWVFANLRKSNWIHVLHNWLFRRDFDFMMNTSLHETPILRECWPWLDALSMEIVLTHEKFDGRFLNSCNIPGFSFPKRVISEAGNFDDDEIIGCTPIMCLLIEHFLNEAGFLFSCFHLWLIIFHCLNNNTVQNLRAKCFGVGIILFFSEQFSMLIVNITLLARYKPCWRMRVSTSWPQQATVPFAKKYNYKMKMKTFIQNKCHSNDLV